MLFSCPEADFAKLVELFDAHAVSFVSVTQAFNTTSSMRRLTLTVLLSFAQLKREVTGERIRDHGVQAQALWMGGIAPIGYMPNDQRWRSTSRTPRGSRIRQHYGQYLELGGFWRLKPEVDRLG